MVFKWGGKRVENIREMLVAIFLLTMSFGVIYLVNQQSLRQSGNDPQVIMVEEYSAQLESGLSLGIFKDMKLVDIEISLSPYVLVYDDKKVLKFSSARLKGKVPSFPDEVLDYTLIHKEERITWQPLPGVNQAVIVKSYKGSNGGFIVVGKSLREVEIRERNLTIQVLYLWIISLVLIVVMDMFIRMISIRRK